jgi:hypothetical protein
VGIAGARVSREQMPGASNGHPAAIDGFEAGFGGGAVVGGELAVGRFCDKVRVVSKNERCLHLARVVVGMLKDAVGLIAAEARVPIAQKELPVDFVGQLAKQRLHFIAAVAVEQNDLPDAAGDAGMNDIGHEAIERGGIDVHRQREAAHVGLGAVGDCRQ